MDIFSDAYVKGTYVPLTLARDHHPAGVEVFDEQILRLLTIEPGASYAEYDSPDKIWAKFGSTFLVSRVRSCSNELTLYTQNRDWAMRIRL